MLKNIVFLICLFSPAFSQLNKFISFNSEDGLSSNSANHILELKNGKLLIGTADGLNLFDSNKFQTFQYNPLDSNSLSNSFITSLFEDINGDIWIGTIKGLNLLRFTKEGVLIERIAQFSSVYIKSILKFKKELYISTNSVLFKSFNSGLYKYNHETKHFSQLIDDPKMWLLAKHKNSIVYSSKYDIIQYNIDNAKKTKLFKIPNSKFIISMSVDDSLLFINNYYWAGIYNFNTNKLSTKLTSKVLLKYRDKNNTKYSRSLFITGFLEYKNKYWYSTHFQGLFIQDKINLNDITHFNTWSDDKTKIFSNKINNISKSKSNSNFLFLSSNGNGFSILNEQNQIFKHYKSRKNIVNNFVEKNSEEIYVFEHDGISLFNRRTFNDSSINKIELNTIGNVKKYRDMLFLSPYDSKKTYIADLNLNIQDTIFVNNNGKLNRINVFEDIIIDSLNNLVWYNVRKKGLMSFDINKNIVKDYFDIFDGKSLNDLFLHNNKIYFAHVEEGYSVFDIKTEQLLQKNITAFKSINKMERYDDDNIWIASIGSGLILFNTENETYKQYTTKDGLASNSLYDIVKLDSVLWISSNKGLIRFNIKDEVFLTFDKSDGLQTNDFTKNDFYVDSKRNIYIGGRNGFNKFSDTEILQEINVNRLPFFIKALKLETKKEIRIINNVSYDIEHDIKFFSVSFNRIDYGKNGSINYKYRFANKTKTWTNIAKINELFFSNLSYGHYELEIAATDRYNKWQDDSKILYLNLLAPFYAEIWFYVLITLVILSLIVYFIVFAFKRKIEIEKIRIQIASDLHDDLGADLSKINMYSSLINSDINSKMNIEYNSKLSKISSNVISKLDDLVWAIDQRNDTLDSFLERLEFILIDQLRDTNISFDLKKVIKTNVQIIKSNIRTNILFILKEALSNTVKYSKAKKVMLKLIIQDNLFQLTITDDGTGFKYDETKGNGLKNMKMRAAKLNALSFIQESEKGTKILLKVIV